MDKKTYEHNGMKITVENRPSDLALEKAKIIIEKSIGRQ